MDFTPSVRRAPASSGRRATAAPVTGAVRRSSPHPPARTRTRHVRKLSAALVLVTTGILAATTGTGTGGQPAPRTTAPSLPAPMFFFDDAVDALAERVGRDVTSRPALPATAERSPGATIAPVAGANGPSLDAGHAVTPPEPPAVAAERASLVATRERATTPVDAIEREITVERGDTLSGILHENGVRIEQMPALLADEVVERYLSRLEIGQTFTLARLPDGRFHSLAGKVGIDKRVVVRRTGDAFAAAAIDLPVEKERVVTSGTIEQSLYIAAEQADLKQSTIMTLADIFQWELDFARDIRRGDQFAVVYDRLYREGKYIGDGDILAAEFKRGGRIHRAIRFVADDGTSGYYAPDGTSKRRTFLRHPVDVVRITSKFDPNRLHPVLHQIRAHRGVDYGAPYGSPIRATADGVVKFSGTKSAYGNTVILQHGKHTKTLYAHMSRISDKSTVGSRVRQGDVIGYVGNTGRVTGTHLHYEFRIDDKHVDPLTVELPAAAPLAVDQREALQATSEELLAQMRSVLPDGNDQVAVNAVAAAAAPLDGADMIAGGPVGDTSSEVARP